MVLFRTVVDYCKHKLIIEETDNPNIRGVNLLTSVFFRQRISVLQ
jgi:hypothetical protein